MRYRVPSHVLEQTFSCLRDCGRGQRECQALWLSNWQTPFAISRVSHPQHSSHAGGFSVSNDWLNNLWLNLSEKNEGIRVQVHTHPGEAFHSATDDAFPIVHTPGFLSLVIPDFAIGPIGFHRAYLAEIDQNGRWRQVPIDSKLEVVT